MNSRTQLDTTLYRDVIETSKQYLGSSGEYFMRRQIITHLHITPEQLRSQDLDQLVSWAEITFALITNNSKSVNAFSESLRALALRPYSSPLTAYGKHK